jgi:RNA polymerase sigma-70 factor, ECF subfamily
MSEVNDYLWGRICLGDQKAFDSLFKEMYPHLCAFAQKILNNQSEVEEIVQDTFISLWQNKKEITIKSSLKSYLYQMVHHHALNKLAHFKTQKFQPNTLVSLEQWKQIYNSFAIDDSFIQSFEATETEQLILRAVDNLPDRCREVFMLSRYEDLSNEEISEKLQLSPSTVRVQIFRALESIKEFLSNKSK